MRHFGDFILLAWSEIEANINVIFLFEFGLPPKLELREGLQWPLFGRKELLLLDIPFNKRVDFLNQIGAIKKDEIAALRKFQKDRNRYFHGKEPPFVHLSEKDREKIMDTAWKATEASFNIAQRSVSKNKKEQLPIG